MFWFHVENFERERECRMRVVCDVKETGIIFVT